MVIEDSIDNREYIIFVSETETVPDDRDVIDADLDEDAGEFDTQDNALICRMQDGVVRRVLSLMPSERFSTPPPGYAKVVAKRAYRLTSFTSLGQNIVMYEFLRYAEDADRPSITDTTLDELSRRECKPRKGRYKPSGEFTIEPKIPESRKPPVHSGIPGAIAEDDDDEGVA
ncbi:hypothetical protein ACFL2V_11560 [Pseudomonadota bacterium]